ncbi:thioredoxin-disulfide reductase [Candidatus Bathyarchaeota archaeon]|nr:thioredoxin-disulfide reductase [Candidatus Bathyarchaeota archaeon]
MPKLVVIGSGPAGLTAAIYAARGGLQVKVIEGSSPGGQLMLTTEVENYPGFPQPIDGPDLISLIRKQAERFGAEFIAGDATEVDFTRRPFKIRAGELYEADAVIVATGASSRWLGLESEKRLRGRGVSSCATCDGYFFKDKDVMVVGGGDTAVEEAIFLSKIARNVTVVHRRDMLRAARHLQERAFKIEKIRFLWSSVVEEILGVDRVEGVKVKDLKTGWLNTYSCDAVFVAIGHTPNTEIFRGQIELDDAGYVKTQAVTRTSREGVFAAGDVADRTYRQAVTAAGSGCQAAIDVIKYLESTGA